MTPSFLAHWHVSTLDAVCSSLTDGDHLAPPKAEEGVPFITISAMNDGNVTLQKATRFVPRSYYESLSDNRRARPGDILLSVTGSLGIAAPVTTNDPFVFQRHIAILRPDQQKIDHRFLLYFLRSPQTRESMADSATGTAQMTISLGALRRFPTPLPPLAEQRRIVARIEALFARTRRARADLERIPPLSRRHRDCILVNAFETGVPLPISDLASSVFDGPFGSNLKSDDYTVAGTRVVRLENIGHLRFVGDKERFISDDKADGLRRHQLQQGDVLFSSFIDKEVRVCLFPSGQPTRTINKADCFCIRVDPDRADPRYVALRLASPTTYENMRNAVHGATRPRIGITDLKQYAINVPSVAEQCATAERVERQHAMAGLIQHEATRTLALLDRLEQSILTRAFRGELVPQDPADEPARLSPTPIASHPRRRRAAPSAAAL